jgi:hypothetical protein
MQGAEGSVVESLIISLPGDIDPEERSERFGGLLEEAFQQAGDIGQVVGGGTMLAAQAGCQIVGADIQVEVTDLERGLSVMGDVLARAGAPQGTTVYFTDSGEVVLSVNSEGVVHRSPLNASGRTHTSCPWEEGELVGYQLSPGVHVLLHALRATGWPVVRILDWVGNKLPPEETMRQLLANTSPRPALRFLFLFLGYLGRELDPNRVVHTGVTVAATSSTEDSVKGLRSWAEFDHFLAEVFGEELGKMVAAPGDGSAHPADKMGR